MITFKKNDLIDLLLTANKNQWCDDYNCHLCHNEQFRDAVKYIGHKHLFNEMLKLEIADIRSIPRYERFIRILISEFKDVPEIDSRFLEPNIIQEYLLEFERTKMDWVIKLSKSKEIELNQQIEHLNKKISKLEERRKIDIYNTRKKCLYENELANFNKLTIVEKLAFISNDSAAKTVKYINNYYQLDLNAIPDEILLNLDIKIKKDLINKFADINQEQTKRFLKKLNQNNQKGILII